MTILHSLYFGSNHQQQHTNWGQSYPFSWFNCWLQILQPNFFCLSFFLQTQFVLIQNYRRSVISFMQVRSELRTWVCFFLQTSPFLTSFSCWLLNKYLSDFRDTDILLPTGDPLGRDIMSKESLSEIRLVSPFSLVLSSSLLTPKSDLGRVWIPAAEHWPPHPW